MEKFNAMHVHTHSQSLPIGRGGARPPSRRACKAANPAREWIRVSDNERHPPPSVRSRWPSPSTAPPPTIRTPLLRAGGLAERVLFSTCPPGGDASTRWRQPIFCPAPRSLPSPAPTLTRPRPVSSLVDTSQRHSPGRGGRRALKRVSWAPSAVVSLPLAASASTVLVSCAWPAYPLLVCTHRRWWVLCPTRRHPLE